MKSSSTSVVLSEVSVAIPIFSSPQQRSIKELALKMSVGGRLAQHQRITEVVALDNISLHVPSGTRLGVLGHNGAGKTTLLRVIAGILKPTTGTLRITGRVSAMITTTAALHPEMTGYEFIDIQSSMFGANQMQIDAATPTIAEFTELGDYLRLPVRTYSQGMQTRLSFAVATAYPADILVLDEGLGAGDEAFRAKANVRFLQWLGSAGIVVLASHSHDLIAQLCEATITIDHGRIVDSTI